MSSSFGAWCVRPLLKSTVFKSTHTTSLSQSLGIPRWSPRAAALSCCTPVPLLASSSCKLCAVIPVLWSWAADISFLPCQSHVLSPSLMLLSYPLSESPPLELEKPDPVCLVGLVILPPSSLNNSHEVGGWDTQEEQSLFPPLP